MSDGVLNPDGPEAGEPTIREYLIPASLEDAARDKVTKVNRRLRRLGLSLYQIDTRPGPVQPAYDRSGCSSVINGVPHYFEQGRMLPCPIIGWYATVEVTITGDLPRLPGGWEPVAVLTRDQGGPVITRVWPGLTSEPDLSTFRGTDPICEHCHLDRQRTDTFVVRSTTTGQMMQVGRNCLTAFTGVRVNIPTWVYTDDGFSEMDSWGAGGGDARVPVIEALATACVLVAEYGWVSRAAERDSYGAKTATAELAADLLWGTSPTARQMQAKFADRIDEAQGEAATVRAHAVSMASEPGEYAQNLSTLAAQDWVGRRNLPLLCSAVSAWRRHQEAEVRRQVGAASEWQGTVGQRGEWTLTVTNTTVIDGYYGSTTLVCLVDAAGNRFKWFSSKFLGWGPGDVVMLRGTIKEHGEYRGARDTQLTRCTVKAHTPAPVEVA